MRSVHSQTRPSSGTGGRLARPLPGDRHLKALYEIVFALTEAETLAEAAPQLLCAIKDAERWDWAGLWLVDSTGDVLRLLASEPSSDFPAFHARCRSLAVAPGIGLPGRVWAAGTAAWIEDLSTDSNFPPIAAATKDGLQSGTCFPLYLGDHTVGCIELFSRERRDYDEATETLAIAAAGHIEGFLKRRQEVEQQRRAHDTALGQISDLRCRLIDLELDLDLARTATSLLEHERREASQQADLLKDQFLTILSHELRTPLNVITGYGSLLEDGIAGPLSKPQLEYLTQMMGGADRLLGLIDDLLAMSRIQAGKFSLDRRPMRIPGVVKQAVKRLKTEFERKGLLVINEVPDDLPALMGDEQRLAQVLLNLMDNAIKFTPAGGTVRLNARAEHDYLLCEVEDTGIGIRTEDLPELFACFTQGDTSMTREAGGAGIGLAICKAIVEAHGGLVGARSTPGEGSVFWFTLPLRASG